MKLPFESGGRIATANLSFLAGAGTILVAWLIQEYRRKVWQDRLDKYLPGSDDLLLLADSHNAGKGGEGPSCIYLDYNGTTPIYPYVIKAMMPYLTKHFGNPSSGHFYSQAPKQAIDRARVQVLTLLGRPTANPSSVWFTSCGTESDNLAIAVALQSNAHKEGGAHVVTCNVEHAAIEGYLNVSSSSPTPGCTVTYVPVQSDGRVRASDMIAAIQPNTVLVTLMLANNETGALQPVHEVSQYCREHGILFHTDAAQAAGKVSVALDDMGDPDLVSIVGHKLGAPKGVACLYVRPGCLDEDGRQMHDHGVTMIGGGQEFGRRGGTPNVPYIVGLGAAAADTAQHWVKNAQHMAQVREYLLDQLQERLGAKNVRPNGPAEAHLRLPNTLSVGLRGVHSGDLLASVGHMVAASAGATCHSAQGVSAVLRAMQVPMEFARGTLRLSVGPHTTFPEAERAAQILALQAEIIMIQARMKDQS